MPPFFVILPVATLIRVIGWKACRETTKDIFFCPSSLLPVYHALDVHPAPLMCQIHRATLNTMGQQLILLSALLPERLVE